MRSLLLYNPKAGRDRDSRRHLVSELIMVLQARGFDVVAEPTTAKGSAQVQSAEAVRRGTQAIFACGGDGTVHDVLQGVAGTDACLGILPAGSANALARELKLPMHAVRAAQLLSPSCSLKVRTTMIRRADKPALYSLCMAGAGPDGLLMYEMLTVERAQLGRWRYYEQALRLFLTQRLPAFQVEVENVQGCRETWVASAVMVLRVGDLGGVFSGIARGASLQQDALHVVLVRPPSLLTIPLWIVLSWLRAGRLHPGLHTVKAKRIVVRDNQPWQVDGEWVGRCDAEISLDGPVQRLLVPESKS